MEQIDQVVNGDVTLRVRTYGEASAPLLIALHGWPDSSRGWRHVAPLLAERFRVVTPDLRGFAGSSKPVGTDAYRMSKLIADVHAVADWAGAERFFLAGHDYGGAITWAIGCLAPERIERAVVMASPHPRVFKKAGTDPRQLMRSSYAFLMNIGLRGEALLRANDYEMLTSFAFGGVEQITAADLAEYRAEWSEPGTFTAMSEYYRAHYPPDLLNPEVPLDLPAVTVPTRYVHGTRDFAFVEALATGSGEFVSAPYDEVHLDSTHWMLYEQPVEVAKLIGEWCLDRDL